MFLLAECVIHFDRKKIHISWRKNKKLFWCGALFLYVVHEVFIEVSLFQETCSARKILDFAPVTFNLTFHPNCHPNILVYVNLPIYRQLIHDNISLVFWKPTIVLVLFWRKYKILFVHINICITETLVGVILKKIYIIFI